MQEKELVFEPFQFLYLYPAKLGSSVVVPQDLQELVDQTKTILRGQSTRYPPNLIADNDLAHVQRLFRMASSLALPADENQTLTRMLFLHDLPEIETLDIPAVDKGIGKHDDHQIEVTEDEVARRIFSDDDYLLFSQFNTAKAVFEKKGSAEVTIPVSYIARVLDIVDGNLGTYHFLSLWSISPDYDPAYYFPDDISNYMERQYVLYSDSLKNIAVDTQYKELCEQLFRDQFAASLTMWLRVPQERIPAKHWESLLWAKKNFSL